MVGLQCSARDQGLRPLVSRFSHEKFQFTRFVTTKGETCLVVPFDQQTRPAQKSQKDARAFQWELANEQNATWEYSLVGVNLLAIRQSNIRSEKRCED